MVKRAAKWPRAFNNQRVYKIQASVYCGEPDMMLEYQ